MKPPQKPRELEEQPPSKTKKPKFSVALIKEALSQSGGIFTGAAQILNCAPNTIRNYVRRSKALQDHLGDVQEITLDIAESTLIKAIQETARPDAQLRAVMFYLKTKGRSRGYVERTEVAAPAKGTGGLHIYLPEREENV